MSKTVSSKSDLLLSCPAEADSDRQYHGHGKTETAPVISTVHMHVDEKPCALFHFGDAVRASSKTVIQGLKDRGYAARPDIGGRANEPPK